MADEIYIAGDFSGIQRFVLRVKTAGKAQAKRLRARSFLLQLLEHAALSILRTRFGLQEQDVLVQGGGGFLVRLRGATGDTEFHRLATDLQDMLWEECGGQMQVSLGWAATPTEARAELERRKRMPGAGVLQQEGAWDLERLSQPPLGEPCAVCGDFPGTRMLNDEDGKVLHCRICAQTRRIGQDLTRREWIRVGRGELRVLGVEFELLPSKAPGAWRVDRWVPRDPSVGNPLTFEDLSRRSRGDSRLAVLKADVDDMGQRVGEVARTDPSYRRLRGFSGDLHAFFGDRIREMLKEHWPLIYTLYAGGDDLLVVGPWDVTLDFAGELESAFQSGPATAHRPLTLSAGIALTPYRVPIRHAVERAEKLLDQAKARPGKNRCATLGGDWTWGQHREVVANGKMIAKAVAGRAPDRVPRGLLLRLLQLAEASPEGNLQAARWSYQVARNVPRYGKEVTRFRDWTHRVVGHLDERDDQRMRESVASLRYALLATRGSTGGSDG